MAFPPAVTVAEGEEVKPIIPTFWMYVPSGLPGARPSPLNWDSRYATVLSSPRVPGALPSNASELSTRMCDMRPSSVIEDRAGVRSFDSPAGEQASSSETEAIQAEERRMGSESMGGERSCHAEKIGSGPECVAATSITS